MQRVARPGHSRRSFVAKLGVGGLTAAATIFGTSGTALASTGCCRLSYNPPNKTMSECRATCEYIWYCSVAGLRCTCCEANKPDSQGGCVGGNIGSAYSCQA
jgi:hypothetical protein